MEPVNFLKQKLQSLAEQFPHVHILCAYNDAIATHIVELTPEHEYHQNEDLDRAWIPISLEFMQTFEEENISFVSSVSSLAVKEAKMTWNAPELDIESTVAYLF